MPISLENTSNIRVTYNTGSSYIIETVKSDLYVRGTTSGDLSNPDVSPTLTTNIATFTHSGGTENQTPHTIYFPESTVCDILMIGGGGGGGIVDAGGGGAGACIVAIGQTFTKGIYTIRVGKGGLGGIFSSTEVIIRNSTDGNNSSIFNQQGNEIFRAVGGGRAGGLESARAATDYIGKTGGCGGGAGFWQGTSGRSGGSASTLNIVNNVQNIGPSVTSTYGVYGNSGGSMQQWTNGNYSTANAGGGGGIGAAGASGNASTNRAGVGGNGLNAVTINSVTYNFSNHFANGGVFGVNGYIGGGGGGGGFSNSPAKISGGLGGGGTGDCAGNNTVISDAPTNGAANTGSGGGGACGNAGANGGDGGSGIVIIRYKKKAEPIDNNVRKKITLEYKENSYIREFRHSGGTENQTEYRGNNGLVLPTEATADILIVGGGGGGTVGHGAGGGAGQLVFIHNAILNGTYEIKVGKGGNGSTASGDSSTMGTITNGTKGSDSQFGSVIAEGGGICVDDTLKNGGSGAGGDGHLPDGGVGNKGLKNTTVDTFSSGTVYSKGNDGGNGGPPVGQGGGGGGAGSAGTAGGVNNDSQIGNGGNGLSGITEISYDFKTNFGNYGKLESDGKYWFAGGGAGGVYYLYSSVISNGGKGGGGSTAPSVAYTKVNGGNGVNGTGGGGAGGSAWYGNGGNGGSGIVIVKYKFANDSKRYRLHFPRKTKVQFILNGDGNRITSNDLQGTYIITITSTKIFIEKEGGGPNNKQEFPSNKIEIIYDLFDTLDNINSTFTDSLTKTDSLTTTKSKPINVYNNTLSSINNGFPFQQNKYNKYKISGFIPKANKNGDNNINFNIDLMTQHPEDTSRLITIPKDLYSIRYNFQYLQSENEITPIDIYITIKPLPGVINDTISYFAFKTYFRSSGSGLNSSEIQVFLSNTLSIDKFNEISDWITNLNNKNIWGLSNMDKEISDIIRNLLSVDNIDNKCKNDNTDNDLRICDIRKLIYIKNNINNTPVSSTGSPRLIENVSVVSQNVFPRNSPYVNFNIDDYISYESPSIKAPLQRNTTFDIKNTATKYMYFYMPTVSI